MGKRLLQPVVVIVRGVDAVQGVVPDGLEGESLGFRPEGTLPFPDVLGHGRDIVGAAEVVEGFGEDLLL